MLSIIDTHAHLYLSDFDADRAEMLERAKVVGVQKIFLPAIDSATHASMVALEKSYPFCRAMMGVHPCSIKENYREELDIAKAWWDDQSFIAVGEIGLDFYWDRTFEKEQHIAFREQIEWAISKNVPIVIHSRNATLACVDVLKDYKHTSLQGVFHCFSGSYEEAKEIIKLGFYLGIGGVLTYKNAGIAQAIEEISLEHIILETDAPYLTPVPHRGKRNESSYTVFVAEKLATIKRISTEEVALVTTKNAERLFVR